LINSRMTTVGEQNLNGSSRPRKRALGIALSERNVRRCGALD
jgi:hypothetical protein